MATKIYIVYYSTWGHVATLAEEIKKGADSVPDVEVTIWRVPETLPEEVLGKMHAAPGREDHPVITARQLADADGILFGFPTRFGMMAAQMKAFFDSTGGLWQAQSLSGKPAGVFFATGTQGGGQETTALTAVTQLTHHGMLFVPVGYIVAMFPVRWERGTGTRDESRRLEKIGYSGGIHLSNDFSTAGTRSNQFRYDEPGTVPWVEEREPLLVGTWDDEPGTTVDQPYGRN